jgi:deazaflavin-dependent oxidoreductase (nitroreductase family)
VGRKSRRPGLLLRWFFRAPVVMYRIGLGWLMPMQVMLTTVGRKSGQPRRAVVDVLKHDAESGAYYVASAYGGRSDWYRNLEANPAVEVQVRGRRFSARAVTLPTDEAEEMLLDFWRRHRVYVSTMFRLIGLKAGTEEEAREAVRELKVVAIRSAASQPVVAARS